MSIVITIKEEDKKDLYADYQQSKYDTFENYLVYRLRLKEKKLQQIIDSNIMSATNPREGSETLDYPITTNIVT